MVKAVIITATMATTRNSALAVPRADEEFVFL